MLPANALPRSSAVPSALSEADRLSVIVTAHNCGPVIRRTLQSVVDAIDWLNVSSETTVATEVVVVDDGSSDQTAEAAAEFAGRYAGWKVVLRERPTNPAFARNLGVRASQGDLLFFLDGDDLFLPMHLAVCRQALADATVDFVKTKVRLAHPVHGDWRLRIENSLAINLCIRRRCHNFCGGFPDDQLFRRIGDELQHELDIFYKLEDTFYNYVLNRVFRGRRLALETVEYCRHRGNSFDRQYEKFCQPFGAVPEYENPDDLLRLRVASALAQHRVERLKATWPPANA